jgi:hypothetical protein
MTIDHVDQLDSTRFLEDYVQPNTPVVVTGALSRWRLADVWTPEHLANRFGHEIVQVYNNYFDLSGLMSFKDYLSRYFGNASPRHRPVPYVRWYTKLRDVEFAWADDVFRALRDNWDRPSFLPETDYVLPFCPPPRRLNPAKDFFPAKALFVSGAGAKTTLHVDPWGSEAILCQLYGRKTWLMYSPAQASSLTSGKQLVDPDKPDTVKFPNFRNVRPTYEFTIAAGDTVFVPHGWFHHVKTDTDSISLTWNFVHETTRDALMTWLAGELSETDLDIVRFLLKELVGPTASAAEICTAIRSTRSSEREGFSRAIGV